MAKLKLSPPWVLYYKKLSALFDEDKTIKIIYDEDNMEVKIYSTWERKAKALSFLLPEVVSFGNVELKITIVPANVENNNYHIEKKKFITEDISTCQAAISVLFDSNEYCGNKHVKDIASVDTPYGEFLYVIFKKEVIQYYEDNISDFYGNKSILCEDIAREVFKDVTGVFFCTSNE